MTQILSELLATTIKISRGRDAGWGGVGGVVHENVHEEGKRFW